MKPAFDSLHYPFAIDEALGRVAREPDYPEHVDQLMRQVLLTSPGERINRPDFGCGLRRLLFAPNNPAAATLAQVTIHEALDRWLSSVITVGEVLVVSLESTVEIKIAYVLKARQERRYLNLEIAV